MISTMNFLDFFLRDHLVEQGFLNNEHVQQAAIIDATRVSFLYASLHVGLLGPVSMHRHRPICMFQCFSDTFPPKQRPRGIGR